MEAQKDLMYLRHQRKSAEEEEQQLRQEFAELILDRDRIDVSEVPLTRCHVHGLRTIDIVYSYTDMGSGVTPSLGFF